MHVIATMTDEELAWSNRVGLNRDAAECSPHDLSFEQAKEIFSEYLEFLRHLHDAYDLDEIESVTLSAVTGEIMYGSD